MAKQHQRQLFSNSEPRSMAVPGELPAGRRAASCRRRRGPGGHSCLCFGLASASQLGRGLPASSQGGQWTLAGVYQAWSWRACVCQSSPPTLPASQPASHMPADSPPLPALVEFSACSRLGVGAASTLPRAVSGKRGRTSTRSSCPRTAQTSR